MGNGLARFSVLLSVSPFGTSSDSGAEQLFPDRSATEPLKLNLVGFGPRIYPSLAQVSRFSA
jgi:hypothetical protein